MIRSIKTRCSEVSELIRNQEKAVVGQAEEFMKEKELQIVELKQRNAEMEELLKTEDSVHFFQVTSAR